MSNAKVISGSSVNVSVFVIVIVDHLGQYRSEPLSITLPPHPPSKYDPQLV